MLADTKTELSDTVDELEATNRELTSTKNTLTVRTNERDGLQGDLEAKQAELATTQGALNDARGKVDLQASVIEDLRTCLNGVADALLYLSDFYYEGALAALESAEPACERAATSVV